MDGRLSYDAVAGKEGQRWRSRNRKARGEEWRRNVEGERGVGGRKEERGCRTWSSTNEMMAS